MAPVLSPFTGAIMPADDWGPTATIDLYGMPWPQRVEQFARRGFPVTQSGRLVRAEAGLLRSW